MFFFLSWWLVKVESWWITWPWTSIRGFKSLAMTLFFARCRYWNWHQTADKVTGQVLEIDNRQSGAKNKLSDLVFLSGKYHISLTFPRDFGFVWQSFSSVICYYISITVFESFKKVSFCNIDSMDKDDYGWTSLIQWTKIMMDELHFSLLVDMVIKMLSNCLLDEDETFFGYFETL